MDAKEEVASKKRIQIIYVYEVKFVLQLFYSTQTTELTNEYISFSNSNQLVGWCPHSVSCPSRKGNGSCVIKIDTAVEVRKSLGIVSKKQKYWREKNFFRRVGWLCDPQIIIGGWFLYDSLNCCYKVLY